MIKRSSGRSWGVASVLTVALAACVDSALGPNPENVEFDPSLGIDLGTMTETASGLFFLDEVVGTGDSATVDYDRWLADGTALGGGVFKFILGATPPEAIAGFDKGVTGMRVGGVRSLVIPSSLAYGSTGATGIPGDAVLVYDLALRAIRKPPF
jgi:FKBP-type peptidyl-prolyl cis-trans isomerase FkpA